MKVSAWCLHPRARRLALWLAISAMLAALGSLDSVPLARAVEPDVRYQDQVPPIDRGEFDALAERVQEARKRLEQGNAAVAEKPRVAVPPEPLPPPIQDERDGVPAIDLQEVDALRQAFHELQVQASKEHTAPSRAAPPSQQ